MKSLENNKSVAKLYFNTVFTMSDPKPIKIKATASYKSAVWKSFGYGVDENMPVVKREETVLGQTGNLLHK